MMALLLAAVALGGCATSIADIPLIGTPSDAPARPKEPGSYLPVHDVPTTREGTALAPAEQAKLQAELIAARDRQAQAVASPPTPPAKTSKPPATAGVSKVP